VRLPTALLLFTIGLTACGRDGATQSSKNRLSFIPQSWTVPAWFIDPKNSTNAANDSNTCTTAADPCLTFAGVSSKWGTYAPRLRQNTTITFLSSHSDDADPVYLRPFIESGALVMVRGALGPAQLVAPGTLSNVMAKNRPAGQLLRATLPLGAAPGQLVINTAKSSRAWVYRSAGTPADWFLSQPLEPAIVPGADINTFPIEDDGWANGDPISLYQPVMVDLVEAKPTLVDSVATSNNLTFYQLGVLAPNSPFADLRLNSSVYFVETSIGRATTLGMTGANLLPAFVNVDFASDAILGYQDPYVHVAVVGGQLRTPGFFGDWRGADIVNDFIVGGGAGVGGGVMMSGGGYGTVFVDATIDLTFGAGPVVVPASFNPSADVIWGPGAVSLILNTRAEYPPGLNQAQKTFLQTGGLLINGSPSACAVDPTQPLSLRCGIALTPANLDTAVSAGGFGGLAFIPGGGSITNGAIPPPSGDGGPADGGTDGGADATPDGEAGVGPGPLCVAPDAGSAPPGPPVCGDGWRDPATEECDDGLGAAPSRRACSAECWALDELAVAPKASDSGAGGVTRTLGVGRHPLASSDSSTAVAFQETTAQPLALFLATFTSKGDATGTVIPFNQQSTVTQAANPVVAAVPCDRYAAAWSDLGGDGDSLGVAVRIVDPTIPPGGPPAFANTTTAFSQYDPDIVWTGSQLVVAWVDDSNAQTAPDVRFRTFDANINPTSDEQTLAATPDSEADVALAAFAGSWAAAWRDDTSGIEQIRVHTGAMDWTVGPFLPGPANDKPALAELDATHLLLAYSVGIDTTGSGVANGSKIQVAVLDTAIAGNQGIDLLATATAARGLAQAQPNLVVVQNSLFAAWWTAASPGSATGEELWLKPLAWNGMALDVSQAELPLPRWPQARAGDQRLPAMAASTLPPGGALVLGWDDLGKGNTSGEGNGDVVVEVAPVPLLRTAADGGP
jgi:hypothetical protein